jgi:hypothetical protein
MNRRAGTRYVLRIERIYLKRKKNDDTFELSLKLIGLSLSDVWGTHVVIFHSINLTLFLGYPLDY